MDFPLLARDFFVVLGHVRFSSGEIQLSNFLEKLFERALEAGIVQLKPVVIYTVI
jgi:hypothetical protein